MLALVTFLVMGLLVLAPPVASWWAAADRSPTLPKWRSSTFALLAPLAAGYLLVALVWLIQFEGLCGGWNGETAPCGFGQFMIETLFMTAMTLVMPGILGIALGVFVLALLRLRRSA
jgi:hypothetical protein